MDSTGDLPGSVSCGGCGAERGTRSQLLGSVAVSGLADAREAYERMALRSAKRMLLEIGIDRQSALSGIPGERPASSADQRVSQICGGVTEHEFTNGALNPGWENNPQVVKYFDRNAPSQKPVHGPLLVISAEADSAVPAEMLQDAAGMCEEAGGSFLPKEYLGFLDVSSVMGTSTAEQISWIKARFDGYAAPSNCP